MEEVARGDELLLLVEGDEAVVEVEARQRGALDLEAPARQLGQRDRREGGVQMHEAAA